MESPVGVNFLHNLTLALHFEFTKVGCASIRNICNFLELTQLSRFVAPSYGTHQKISDQMDIMIGKFGDKEEARLSILMEEKLITICEDETFHPQTCLVAIDPESSISSWKDMRRIVPGLLGTRHLPGGSAISPSRSCRVPAMGGKD